MLDELALWRIGYRILAGTPTPIAIGGGARIVELLGGVLNEPRRRADLNLSRTGLDSLAVRRGFARTVARFAFLLARVPRLSPAEIRQMARIEGEHHYHEARAQGRGVLLAGAHFGQWVFGVRLLDVRGVQPVLVLWDDQRPHMRASFQSGGVFCGNRTVGHIGSAVQVARHLAAGETVCVMLDALTPGIADVQIPFFGHSALASPAVARLAAITGAPLLPVSTRWCEEEGRYVLRCSPPAKMTGDPVADTQYLYRILEADIRTCPDQWFWTRDMRWVDR